MNNYEKHVWIKRQQLSVPKHTCDSILYELVYNAEEIIEKTHSTCECAFN